MSGTKTKSRTGKLRTLGRTDLVSSEPYISMAGQPPSYSEYSGRPEAEVAGQELGQSHPQMSGTGSPPTYIAATDPEAPPPTYESLYGEFKEVKSVQGFASFTMKACGFVCGTVLALILFAILSMIPIAMIAIGSVYLDRCPKERYIPIYLIVGGVFGLIKSIINFYYRGRQRMRNAQNDDGDNAEQQIKPNPVDGIINLFLLAWFIAGSVWVYRAYMPSFDSKKEPHADYCHPVVYWFAFVIITIQYVFMGLALFFCCCCGAAALGLGALGK